MAALSPQLTVSPETVPSGSAEVKVTVIVTPVTAGFGTRLVIVTIGLRSLTVSWASAEPVPAELLAETVTVKVCDFELLVEA
jgi:hypothetical protein